MDGTAIAGEFPEAAWAGLAREAPTPAVAVAASMMAVRKNAARVRFEYKRRTGGEAKGCTSVRNRLPVKYR